MSDVSQASTPAPADAQTAFRRLMGLFTTGVCVVSARAGEHGVVAMTVNSFVSVSLDPMLICWSLQNASSQYDLYTGADRFAVSILADGQSDLAQRYAARGDTMLRLDDFETGHEGLPVIAGSLGHLACKRWAKYPAGDHTMILGEVSSFEPVPFDQQPTAPLGFFNGQFCSIAK